MKYLLSILLALSGLAHASTLSFASNEKASEQVIASCILTNIYAQLGIMIDITPMPANVASMLNQNKKIDGEAARIAAYKPRDLNIIKVQPSYYHLVTTAFFKPEIAAIRSIDDMKKYKVGVVRGIAHAELLVRDIPNVVYAEDYTQLFSWLENNKIEVAIDTSVNGKYMIYKLRLKNIDSIQFSRHDLFHILNVSNNKYVESVSKKITSMETSGELKKVTQMCEDQFYKSMEK